MRITIGQTEFDQAMSCWLDKQGFSPSKFDITVDVIAGRKFGTSAEITLTPKVSDDIQELTQSIKTIKEYKIPEIPCEVHIVPAVTETHKPIFNAE